MGAGQKMAEMAVGLVMDDMAENAVKKLIHEYVKNRESYKSLKKELLVLIEEKIAKHPKCKGGDLYIKKISREDGQICILGTISFPLFGTDYLFLRFDPIWLYGNDKQIEAEKIRVKQKMDDERTKEDRDVAEAWEKEERRIYERLRKKYGYSIKDVLGVGD